MGRDRCAYSVPGQIGYLVGDAPSAEATLRLLSGNGSIVPNV